MRTPEPEQILPPVEWQKVKKLLDRRRFANLASVVSFIELLLRLLTESDESDKKRQGELNRAEATKTREINGIGALNKAVDKILDEKNFKFDEATIARLRKVLETNLLKHDRITEGPYLGWYAVFKDSTATKLRMLAIAEEEKFGLLHEVEELQSYIGQLQTQMKT